MAFPELLRTVRFSTSLRMRVPVGFSTVRFTSRKCQPRGFTSRHRMLIHTSYCRTSIFTHTHTPHFRNGLKHFVNASRLAYFNFFSFRNAVKNQTHHLLQHLSPDTVPVHFVQFSAPIIPLIINSRLVCVTESHSVLCEVGTDMKISLPRDATRWSHLVNIRTISLTFTNSTFCPTQCMYVFCVDLTTNSDYSLYSINWLVCITEI